MKFTGLVKESYHLRNEDFQSLVAIERGKPIIDKLPLETLQHHSLQSHFPTFRNVCSFYLRDKVGPPHRPHGGGINRAGGRGINAEGPPTIVALKPNLCLREIGFI
jgi:hypothetical protein